MKRPFSRIMLGGGTIVASIISGLHTVVGDASQGLMWLMTACLLYIAQVIREWA